MTSTLIFIISFILLAFLQMIFLVSRYIKCPPNKAMVIFGKIAEENKNKHGVQTLVGGRQFVWPVIQEYYFLDLTPYHQKITEEFLSKDLITVPVELSLGYAISTEEDILAEASMGLVHRDRTNIQNIANDIILGSIKKVFTKNDLVTIALQKDKFKLDMVSKINKTLNQIGINLTEFHITYNKKEGDYIKELEQQFKQNKLSNFELPDQEDVQQQLNSLDQKIDTNAQERLDLINQKLNLLTKLKLK